MPWELRLWNVLRNRQINELKFRRQYKIDKYIVDFCCLEKKLIIELDGGHHNELRTIRTDSQRQKFLEDKGYHILRFWNNDIDMNLDGVIQKIIEHSKPHPSPLPYGRGSKGKVIFFGTSEFAAPALIELVRNGYEIAAVVTQPDKPGGRKMEPLPSPIKLAAQKLGLKIFQPRSLGIGDCLPAGKAGTLGISDVDLFVVASYGQIIPAEILNIPKLGALNIHPSLLPKYRGPSPIQAAILNGDKETGVTIIKLDEELDHGPIIAQERITKYESRIAYKKLHDLLADLGSNLLIKTLPDYLAGKITPLPQDDSKATLTKIITKTDARVDWKKSAQEIDRMVRAYSVWPVAWTTLSDKRLRIFESSLLQRRREEDLRAGEVETQNNRIFVNTGDGLLELCEVQLEGSRRMSAPDFVRGYSGLEGKILH